MLSIIRRLLRKTPKVLDLWDQSQSFYVTLYRTGIDRVAEALSIKLEQPVHTRFNLTQKQAELFFEGGVTLATIKVHGNFGCPYEAIITAGPLSEETKKLIRDIFPENLRVKFISL